MRFHHCHGLHREQVVGVEIVQDGGQARQRRRVQLGCDEQVVVDVVGRGERGAVAPHREPHQPDGRARLRGVRAVLRRVEPQPAVVGHEARMALGHARLDRLEVGVGQLLGRRRVAELERRGRHRRDDLLQVPGEHLLAEAEGLAQLQEQVERVEGDGDAAAVPGDRLGVDVPVVEREPLGGEAVGDQAVVAVHDPPVDAVGLGGEQPLVGELGERLAHQRAVRGRPALRVEVVHHRVDGGVASM